jgi:FlaA1/EpsC-like NDP-sugar epimerase
MSIPLERLRSRRSFLLAGFDGAVWLASITVFALLASDRSTGFAWSAALLLGAIAAALHVGLGWAVDLHRGRAALGTLDEMMLLGVVAGGVGMLVTAASPVTVTGIAPAVPVAATFTALVVMAWARASVRRSREPACDVTGSEGKTRAVIIGAGDAGRQLISSMLRDTRSRWVPVALVDDDPLKSHLRIRGVPVLGNTEVLVAVAEAVRATTVIVAIPSASSELIRDLTAKAMHAGLDLKVLPATNELLDVRVGISDVRDIDVTDLLGRHQIESDLASIANYLTGKRVLVTGAGGSIGSELCRQVARLDPAELIMLDRDESALHAVQLSI